MKVLWSRGHRRPVAVALLWEWRDVWVGAYFDPQDFGTVVRWRLYLCLVPCLPVRVEFWRRRRRL
jgi:hypothetical protein